MKKICEHYGTSLRDATTLKITGQIVIKIFSAKKNIRSRKNNFQENFRHFDM